MFKDTQTGTFVNVFIPGCNMIHSNVTDYSTFFTLHTSADSYLVSSYKYLISSFMMQVTESAEVCQMHIFFIIHQEWLHMYRFHAIKSLNRQENSSINFNLFNKFRTSNILLSIHCHLADNIMNIHVYMIHTVCLQKTNVFLNIV